MKGKTITKMIVTLLAILLAFGISGCGTKPSGSDSSLKTIAVTMNISYPQKSGKTDLKDYPMNVQQGATVLQVLEAYCEREGVNVSVDTTQGSYVTGINQVQATQHTGWVYEVNGQSSVNGADQQQVQNNDNIVWKVTAL